MIDIQAQDRAHRIGQTKPVIVYRFIVRNTIDERVYKRACSKQVMEKLIVHDGLSLSLSRSPQDFILCFRIETRFRRLWHGQWT